MRYNLYRQIKRTKSVRKLLAIALVLGGTLGTAMRGQAQEITPPQTPVIITPPAGNVAFFLGHAEGTQGYVCLPTSAGASTASWTVNNSRPQATLSSSFGQEFPTITHFLSPNTAPNEAAPNPLPFGSVTWQSSFDSSKVWAQVLHSNSIPAGSDPSCPNDGSIPCLLLQSIGSQEGPTGGKSLTKVTFIQRLNTKGGSAPVDGCVNSADIGKQTLVPYTADYFFYKASPQN